MKGFLTKANFDSVVFGVFVLTWPIFRGPGPGILSGTRGIEYVEMSIPLHPAQPILAPPIGHCSERGMGGGDACYFEKHRFLFKLLVQFFEFCLNFFQIDLYLTVLAALAGPRGR